MIFPANTHIRKIDADGEGGEFILVCIFPEKEKIPCLVWELLLPKKVVIIILGKRCQVSAVTRPLHGFF